jgi:4-diphosphocytidyl-2-C-methyl-D-erythritol kinase
MYSIKAYAKVNIFLKITGYENGYHTLLSRFVRVDDLYDTLTITPCECDTFTIEGCDDVAVEENTIYKAYQALLTPFPKLEDFFKTHKVVLEKHIPSQAGLGGGSSDAGAFMRLINALSQNPLSKEELAKLGSTIGADVPFFIYNYPSANVRGFGEIVEPFNEPPLELELFTPEAIGCDTAKVYQTYHKYLLRTLDPSSFFGWEQMDSATLLNLVNDPIVLNDLYPAALAAYPELEKLDTKGWFFSGSGSTFFRVKG